MIHIQDIIEKQEIISKMRWEYWQNHIVFSPQWWFLLISVLLLFIVWLIVSDKHKLLPILFMGVITFSVVSILDTIGGDIDLWDYPIMVLPWGPRILSIDIMISIFFMLIYQLFQTWKAYTIAALGMAFTFAFIFEPIATYLGIYLPLNWSHFYSFPIYFLLAIGIRAFVDKMVSISKGGMM
ncbi:hypothetical protein ACNRWW_02440 [Metabacillus sp. HB246100]